jgi:hypothetical protein
VPEIVLEPNGVVRVPGVHDGYLIGVYGEDTDLILRIASVYGDRDVREFVLHGCSNLSIRNYGEINIVFEVRVQPSTVIDRTIARRLLHRDDADDNFDPGKFLESLVGKSLLLVTVDQSMGADVMALCEKVTYRSLPKEKKPWIGGSGGGYRPPT